MQLPALDNSRKMWKIIIFLSCFAHFVYCYEVIPVISAPKTNHSMSLVWDNCSQSAFYVDNITNGTQNSIFRYDFNEDKVYGAYVDKFSAIAFIMPIGDCDNRTNQYAVGSEHYTIIIEWDGVSELAEYKSTLFGVLENDSSSAMAVARQSSRGHFYGGTYHPTTICSGAKNATIFKYSKTDGVQQFDHKLLDTNGWAFDDNAGKVYQIGSCVGIFSYDADCNSNCQATPVFDFRSLGQHLAGLESNNKGQLFSGSFTNGSIWQIDPIIKTGKVIVNLPYAGCTGVAFGGPNGDILFATVSSIIFDPENTSHVIENNDTPSLYKITELGFKGPNYASLNFD